MLTAERLRDLFHYDPETGIFARKDSGRICNGLNGKGYVRATIDGRRYCVHRLAWLYIHGYWPEQIDHANGIRDDNRLINLRECDRTQNSGNVKRHRDNKSGFKGVYYSVQRGKWRAEIHHRGVKRDLGRFKTAEEAHAAYCNAAKLVFGEYARTN